MSRYTTEVRFICENASGLQLSKQYADVNDIIDKASPKIFNFSYPIFDENYKSILEHKILKHYYTREISDETVSLWKLRLDTKMNEIMPYYNQLYRSELLEFNPLYTNNLQKEHFEKNIDKTKIDGKVTNDNTTKNDSTNIGSATNYNLYSDTPQGQLSGVDSQTYLTNATKDTNSNTEKLDSTSKTDGTTKTDTDENRDKTLYYLDNVVGYNGTSASKLLEEYRKTFLNIDMMVINELEDLFFQLW